MIAEDYRNQLAALLPPGPALPREPDGALMRLLGAPAAELARVEARAGALLVESDPRETQELLPDWERVAGLPDPCLGPTPSTAQRRLRLVQQVTQTRGQSRAFFLSVALSLGVVATITEFRRYTCELDCEQPVHDPAWDFAWRMNLPLNQVTQQTCEDGCETPLALWGDTTVECVVRALAPSHTIPIFAYA